MSEPICALILGVVTVVILFVLGLILNRDGK